MRVQRALAEGTNKLLGFAQAFHHLTHERFFLIRARSTFESDEIVERARKLDRQAFAFDRDVQSGIAVHMRLTGMCTQGKGRKE